MMEFDLELHEQLPAMMRLIDPLGKYSSIMDIPYNSILHENGRIKIEVIIDDKKIQVLRYDKNGCGHSNKGPSKVVCYVSKYMLIHYERHGAYHKNNGPSITWYNDLGKIISYVHYVDGKLHNESGIAFVYNNMEKYCLNDEEYAKEEYYNIISVSRHRDIILALLPQPIAEEMLDAM